MSDKTLGIREHIEAAKRTARPEQLLGQSELSDEKYLKLGMKWKKPNKKLEFRFCPGCGRDNIISPHSLRGRHFAGGSLCPGKPVRVIYTLTYIHERRNSKRKPIICPTCRQDMTQPPRDGTSKKDCPQCGQGLSRRTATRLHLMKA